MRLPRASERVVEPMKRDKTHISEMLILFLAISMAACSWAAEVETAPENRVTFYTTYGAPTDGGWIIPLRIWVHEEPDLVRELMAKAVREELVDRAGMGELDQVQKDRFMYRVDGFIADSESKENVLFSFDGDPDAPDAKWHCYGSCQC